MAINLAGVAANVLMFFYTAVKIFWDMYTVLVRPLLCHPILGLFCLATVLFMFFLGAQFLVVHEIIYHAIILNAIHFFAFQRPCRLRWIGMVSWRLGRRIRSRSLVWGVDFYV